MDLLRRPRGRLLLLGLIALIAVAIAVPALAREASESDDLVAMAVDRARAYAGPEQRIDLHSTPVVVPGEADRLERAVANLLDNAVKYGRGAPIDVRVDRDGQAHATVTVRDHGPGIPEEHLPHVFERFYRAPEARDAAGSGLGLSIVAQVVEAHAGTVEAVAAHGGGTTVTVRLPAATTDG